MAKQTGMGMQMFSGGFDLSGDVGSISAIAARKALLDITAINKSAMERISGLSDGEIGFTAFFNTTAGAAHEALSDNPTTDELVAVLTSATAGDPAAFLTAKQVNYDGTRNSDGSLTFAIQTLAASGVPLEWGEALTAGKVTHASASSSAGVDSGAGTSNGLSAQLQISDIASGTPTFLIEESQNNGGGDAYTTSLSFAAVADGAEPTAQRVTVTGAIEQWLRVTSTGTFTAADITVVARRGTAQDDDAL